MILAARRAVKNAAHRVKVLGVSSQLSHHRVRAHA